MVPQRWSRRPASASGAPAPVGTAGAPPSPSFSPPGEINWAEWLRGIERKRRLLARREQAGLRPFWSRYFVAATDSSFRLDGLILPEADLAAALAPGWARRSLGGRQQQRVRNHVAILRSIERLLARGDALKPNEVVRWYTSVACGLSTTGLDEAAGARLDGFVRQINSPHLRLTPAVQGIARLHRQLLAEPVVPGFNGILARLLLRWHLGRCALPPVVFDPARDSAILLDEPRLLHRLLELIDESYTAMLAE